MKESERKLIKHIFEKKQEIRCFYTGESGASKHSSLSVGYSTCHWCHVMERESFENEEVAKALNDNFISIKVDREERPDVDKVYMTFVQVCYIFLIKARNVVR